MIELDHKREKARGIVDGDTIGAAVDKVSKWFGRENIVSIKAYELEEILYDEDLFDIASDEEN